MNLRSPATKLAASVLQVIYFVSVRSLPQLARPLYFGRKMGRAFTPAPWNGALRTCIRNWCLFPVDYPSLQCSTAERLA